MCKIVIVDKFIEGRTMANKTKHQNKNKKSKGFSLTPKLKAKNKSTHKRAVMGRETFISTQKSSVNFDSDLVRVVDILAKEQSSYVRKTFNIINNSEGSEPSEDWLKSEGFDTTEARNIIRSAKGIYDSQKELVESQYIPDTKSDIRSIKNRIKNLEAKLVKAKSKQKISRTKTLIVFFKNKLNKKVQRLQALQLQLSKSKFSVCFGTKKLMRQFNHSLFIDNLEDYQNKKEEFVFNRDSEFFTEGHADQRAGNQKVKLVKDGEFFTLEISVPKRHLTEVKSFKTLVKSSTSSFAVFDNISFGSTRIFEDIVTAVKPLIKTNIKKNGKIEERSICEYPVSHRLKLVKVNGVKGVQLITTIRIKKAEIVTSRFNGALGVDINQHSIDWTRVDYYGNYVDSGTIPLVTQDKNKIQTQDLIHQATTKIVKKAVKHKVILVIEDLRFKKNSERIKGKGKKFARMASSLPFAQIKDSFQQKCYRFGVELKTVNPAFTSIQGLYNYMRPYGLNGGTAAGMVIARRGLGFKEKIPNYVFQTGFTLEDVSSDKSWKAWGQLAKWRKTIGGFNRHQFFAYGESSGVNCPLEDGSTFYPVRNTKPSEAVRTLPTVKQNNPSVA